MHASQCATSTKKESEATTRRRLAPLRRSSSFRKRTRRSKRSALSSFVTEVYASSSASEAVPQSHPPLTMMSNGKTARKSMTNQWLHRYLR